MAKKQFRTTIYIDKSEYDLLTTRQKLDRVTRFVRMLDEFDRGLLNELTSKRVLTVLKTYLLDQDFNYMSEQERELFKHYGYIK